MQRRRANEREQRDGGDTWDSVSVVFGVMKIFDLCVPF